MFSVSCKIVHRCVTANCCFLGRNVYKYRVIAPRRNQQETGEKWMRSFKICPLYDMFRGFETDWVCVMQEMTDARKSVRR